MTFRNVAFYPISTALHSHRALFCRSRLIISSGAPQFHTKHPSHRRVRVSQSLLPSRLYPHGRSRPLFAASLFVSKMGNERLFRRSPSSSSLNVPFASLNTKPPREARTDGIALSATFQGKPPWSLVTRRNWWFAQEILYLC